MNEPTIRLPSGEVITHCKELIDHYVTYDAYAEYDCGGAPDSGSEDTITRRQFNAINGMMHAHAPESFYRRWCNRPLPELRDIPRDLDLVDGCDDELERGFAAVFRMVSQMAEMNGVGDVAPTKALYLLRPRFVAISDRLVRHLLGIDETQLGGTTDGEWCAARVESVQRAIRALAQDNAAALDKLHAYANRFAGVTAPDLLNAQERREAASKPPVQLSKARVLDILLWSRANWGNAG